jgi:hypothetical protein
MLIFEDASWKKVAKYIVLSILGSIYVIFFVFFWISDKSFGIPVNSFFLITILYVCTAGGLLWFYDDTNQPQSNSFEPDKASIPDTVFRADSHVVHRKQQQHRQPDSLLLAPLLLLGTNRKGHLPADGKNHPFKDYQEHLGIRFFEYSITAGMFLLATALTYGLGQGEVYVYQHAFMGMVVCNAIGTCMIFQLPDTYSVGKGHSLFSLFLELTGTFFASCFCFAAAMYPVIAVCMPLVLGDYMRHNPEVWIVYTIAVSTIVLYALFAFFGWIFLWILPLWKAYNADENTGSSSSVNFASCLAKGTVAFTLLNFIGKITIIGIALGGAFNQMNFAATAA